MIFQKPSTRTRVSFEVGISQLGGTACTSPPATSSSARARRSRTPPRVLSRYLDGIMIRTFAQADVDELAEHADIPVINGLTDEFHPCQALADVMTIRERLGGFEGVRVAYLGDGNNVCHSLMVACAKLGMDFVAATPAGLRAERRRWSAGRRPPKLGRLGRSCAIPRSGEGADVLYTDVWTSMGQEEERERGCRPRRLPDRRRLVGSLSERAVVLHCLPAHYGEEITEDVLYGPRSAVWDQAENRLHAQKALMALVIR